jgi:glutamate synthase (NADPH/NADH) large chain
VIKEQVEKDGLSLLAVRDVPVNSDILGQISASNEPQIKQIFVTGANSQQELELKLYVVRKKIEKAILKSNIAKERSFYIVSLSTKQMVYKGMLTSLQLRDYYPICRILILQVVFRLFTRVLVPIHSQPGIWHSLSVCWVTM